MGEEIKTSQFSKEDFQEFGRRLEEETQYLSRCFEEKQFGFEEPKLGFELETWLVGRDLLPAPINEEFLKELKNPAVVHELSRFNLELNSTPYPLDGKVLSFLHQEMGALWKECQRAAEKFNAEMMSVGILPTLRQGMLSLANMSSSERYLALNDQIFKHRNGEPLRVHIKGKEALEIVHRNVMLEASATSLQIHVNVPQEMAARVYNASLILSAPMVALSANSPFLFGKDLWSETRIPVFEQAVRLSEFFDDSGTTVGRVSLGSGYLEKGFLEAFEENLHRFPPLLPILFSSPVEELRHLRLHNGTIWRWNRPLIGINEKNQYHLRLEHRVAAAGPSLLDNIANMGFFAGCIQALSMDEEAPENKISFSDVRSNLYEAAQNGLKAEVLWFNGKKLKMQEVLRDHLIPLAGKGLESLGVDLSENQKFIQGIIEPRVETGQNGSSWLRKALKKFAGDYQKVTAAYLEHQRIGKPVHEWSL